jgi:Zn-dependent protease
VSLFQHIDLAQRVMMLIALLLSLTVHEWAHAWSAFRLGDDTASMQGRLTLNPISHIDPFGTLILPLLGVPFGWAKPVPVNPTRFRRGINMSTGTIITAAAGPLANVALAILSAVALGLIARFAPGLLRGGGRPGGLYALLSLLIGVNVTLAIFNLIPVPPLDGSRVVDGIVPYSWRPQWESIVRFSPVLLILVVVASQQFGIISAPANLVMGWLGDLISAIRTA